MIPPARVRLPATMPVPDPKALTMALLRVMLSMYSAMSRKLKRNSIKWVVTLFNYIFDSLSVTIDDVLDKSVLVVNVKVLFIFTYA